VGGIMENIGISLSNQVIQFTQDANSNATYCRNSEAIKKGLTTHKSEIKYCEFCGKELEVIGIVLSNILFKIGWISTNKYEKCDCEDSQRYWKIEQERERSHLEKKYKEEKEREYQQRLNLLIKKSNLGERFKTRTFESFQTNEFNKKAYDTCLRYANDFNKIKEQGLGIIITGGYGVGKTHLVAAIAHELMKQGVQPIFGTLISLLDRIRSTYDNPNVKENELQILNNYNKCSLLIIDDLGKEKPSEWAMQRLYEVLNNRYENKMPIIITSNYSIEKLKERLTVNDNYETAEAIISRIYEMFSGIYMQGDDYRKLQDIKS
jgi:DNA replication protein DnaC